MSKITSYNTKSVAKITGLTVRQLDHWQRTDFFKPSVSAAHGSGSRSAYSFDDLVQLKLIAQLKKQGVSLQRLRMAVGYLRSLNENDKITAPVIFADKGQLLIVYKNQTTEPIVVDVCSGQQVMKIMFEEFVAETLRQAKLIALQESSTKDKAKTVSNVNVKSA